MSRKGCASRKGRVLAKDESVSQVTEIFVGLRIVAIGIPLKNNNNASERAETERVSSSGVGLSTIA